MLRFERKFEINNCHKNLLSNFLLSKNLREKYPRRVINSIYYESDELESFSDSMNGICNRKKIRIRYYGEETFNAKLEYKIKKEALNTKVFFDLKDANTGKMVNVKFIGKGFKNIKLDIPTSVEYIYKPKLYISYARSYFISRDDNLRMTIDEDIIFRKLTCFGSYIKAGYMKKNIGTILEIKYNQDYQVDNNLIASICNDFNISLVRSSKYATAISMLHLS